MGMPVIVNSGIDRCESVTDIIQSVALEQAALAHILNAEGEKIQRIVADTTVDTDTIMETNQSVQDMIETIAQLEMILKSKLGMFKDCLCYCDKPCEVFEDSNFESSTVKINVVKIDKNNYIFETDSANVAADFKLSTVPTGITFSATTIQPDMVWDPVNNVLGVAGAIGPVVLSASNETCTEDINIQWEIIVPAGEASEGKL